MSVLSENKVIGLADGTMVKAKSEEASDVAEIRLSMVHVRVTFEWKARLFHLFQFMAQSGAHFSLDSDVATRWKAVLICDCWDPELLRRGRE